MNQTASVTMAPLSFRQRVQTDSGSRRRVVCAIWLAMALGLMVAALVTWRVAPKFFAPWGCLLGMVGVVLVAVALSGYLKPNIGTIFGREMSALFLSPVAYLVLLGMVAVTGLNYWNLAYTLREGRLEFAGETGPMVVYIAFSLFFWVAFIILFPILTMRLMSEEQRSGTIEMLLTAPVTEAEVVLGKYLACFAFYPLLWLPSAFFLVVLYRHAPFDYWPVLSCYLGVISMGAMFVSIGLFFSSLTRNQMVSAIMTAAALIFVFAIAWFYESTRYESLKYLSVLFQLVDLAQGKMDVRYLVLHVSVTVFLLFLTVKVLEARKGH